jgi:hypothetical protein
MLLRKRKMLWRFVKMLLELGVCNPQSTACEVWCLRFQDKAYISDNLPFSYVYCFCIHLYVTICMKLDPGMHIGLHLVFFGKSGVTSSQKDQTFTTNFTNFVNTRENGFREPQDSRCSCMDMLGSHPRWCCTHPNTKFLQEIQPKA